MTTTSQDKNTSKAAAYTTREGWDQRYTQHSGMKAAGTFVHTDNGNRQFYRTKCDALDRVIKATGTTLQHKVVLDAAGGTGRYVPYFLKRGVDHIT
ncbi:MAG: hypothetical protein HC914_16130, partial [Chloroflexaceae bacterium]|nr:hypothetical protein [Chloroflexaceae bacterium]